MSYLFCRMIIKGKHYDFQWGYVIYVEHKVGHLFCEFKNNRVSGCQDISGFPGMEQNNEIKVSGPDEIDGTAPDSGKKRYCICL